MSSVADPTLDVERALCAAGASTVIGIDEVGRGAIAGPVAVGVCAIVQRQLDGFPAGLRDSKMLSEPRRVAIAPLAVAWAQASAVGLASADEVDRLGIVACLGLAAKRALSLVHAQGVDVASATVLLDGSHDWLTPVLSRPLRVTSRVKADRDCASVAAASVISKVHRDQLMIDLDEGLPAYGWRGNKGYGSAQHFEAIELFGPTEHHRRSWLRSERMPVPLSSDGVSELRA